MTRAFIVHIEVDESQLDYLGGLAEDIRDSLESDGHAVVDVKPFAVAPEVTEPLQPNSLGVSKAPTLF